MRQDPRRVARLAGKECLLVPQGYAVMFNRAQVLHWGNGFVGTWGLMPCVGVALFHNSFSYGFVGHFDSDNEAGRYDATDILPPMLEAFRSFVKDESESHYQAYIVKGGTASPGLATKLHDLLTWYADYLERKQSPQGEFVFNMQNHTYHTNVEPVGIVKPEMLVKCHCCRRVFRLKG
jgi:hypothetical protein